MNSLEKRFIKEAEGRGYKVYKNGWPDFLVSGSKAVFCVEVKSLKGRLEEHQEAMHKALAEAGIETILYKGTWVDPLFERSVERLEKLNKDLERSLKGINGDTLKRVINARKKLKGFYDSFTSACNLFLAAYPEYMSLIDSYKKQGREIQRETAHTITSMHKIKADLDNWNGEETT